MVIVTGSTAAPPEVADDEDVEESDEEDEEEEDVDELGEIEADLAAEEKTEDALELAPTLEDTRLLRPLLGALLAAELPDGLLLEMEELLLFT